MKKLLIIAVVSCLFIVSCKKDDAIQAPKTNTNVITASPVTIAPPLPNSTCQNYAIANTERPSGNTLTFTYEDCTGAQRSGTVAPLQTVYVSARLNSVICVGGYVTLN